MSPLAFDKFPTSLQSPETSIKSWVHTEKVAALYPGFVQKGNHFVSIVAEFISITIR